MRKKPNLSSRFANCAEVMIEEPAKLISNWRSLMPDAKRIFVEVGCGKGKFTVETAKQNPDMLLIAIEKVPDCLVIAMEATVEAGLKNLFYISEDACNLTEIFAPGEVDGIYLNFCDPWPRKKNAKRRLTYHSFLERYAWILSPNGKVEFKSDNAKLFAWSVEEMQEYGWKLDEVTDDLHANGPVGVMTGYEIKFYELGTPIHRLVGYPMARPQSKPATENEIRMQFDPQYKER